MGFVAIFSIELWWFRGWWLVGWIERCGKLFLGECLL